MMTEVVSVDIHTQAVSDSTLSMRTDDPDDSESLATASADTGHAIPEVGYS